MMKRILILPILLLLLVGSTPAYAAASERCSLSTLVEPAFPTAPDWILDTVTGLDPTDTYTATLTEPNGVQLVQDIDYGQTSNIQAFPVITFQTGTYSATLAEVGRHRTLATCSLTLP